MWHTCFLEVVTGWRISSSICSENLNNLPEILLYDHGYRWAAKNVYVVQLFWRGICHLAKNEVNFFFFLTNGLYSCDVTPKVLFYWWEQYSNTERHGGREQTLFSLLISCLARGFTVMWQTRFPSVFRPCKSSMVRLRKGECASDCS